MLLGEFKMGSLVLLGSKFSRERRGRRPGLSSDDMDDQLQYVLLSLLKAAIADGIQIGVAAAGTRSAAAAAGSAPSRRVASKLPSAKGLPRLR